MFLPAIPALFIKISIFVSLVIFSISVFTWSKLVTLIFVEDNFGLFNFFNASSDAVLSKSQMITLAPESKKRLVIAKPKPCAPPVTIAVLLLKFNLFIGIIY